MTPVHYTTTGFPASMSNFEKTSIEIPYYDNTPEKGNLIELMKDNILVEEQTILSSFEIEDGFILEEETL